MKYSKLGIVETLHIHSRVKLLNPLSYHLSDRSIMYHLDPKLSVCLIG